MMRKWIILLTCFVSIGIFASCAGRLPSERITHKIVREHFNKYAKKHKKSSFGNRRVENIEILAIQEVHKHLVSVQAFVTMSGPDVYKVKVNIEKGPFGWRFISWENLSG